MPNDNTNSTPIITPIISLLHSRKFLIAVLTAVVDTLVLVVPSLEPVHVELLTVITTLALALIGGIAYEDKGKPAPGTTTSNVTVEAQTVTTPTAVVPTSWATPEG